MNNKKNIRKFSKASDLKADINEALKNGKIDEKLREASEPVRLSLDLTAVDRVKLEVISKRTNLNKTEVIRTMISSTYEILNGNSATANCKSN